MADTLTISLLGSPRIALNGRTLHFASTKATALLAYLAVSGMLHSRDELATLLWPESDDRRGRGALRYTLSLIKKEIGGGFLIANRQQIGLEPTAVCEVDVVQMRQFIALALQPEDELSARQCQTVAQGIALYQADFLQGFTLRDCEQFNEWAFIQANTLRRDLAAALKRLALAYQQQGNGDAALDYGHRWLNLNPLHEPSHCLLMQLYADTGQWTAVHNQYQSLSDLLQSELDTPPLPETAALYQQLCQRRAAQTAIVPEADHTPDQRSQRVLMEKVRRFWVNGLLSPLRDEGTFIQLKLRCVDDAVEHPWADVIEDHQPSTPANVYHAFRNAHRTLLILGAPGAGKTVSLVELAEYLLAMAATDMAQPIPVILNLSSWAGKQMDMADWVVEEMVAKYQIPRRMGRSWLAQDRLLLLFDGLDEMSSTHQANCITALNTFRQAQGLADMAVSCRQEAYETAVLTNGTRLMLNGAVFVRPLTNIQIKESTPPALVGILFQDDALLEMAQSPLVLHMIRAAYETPGQFTAASATPNHIFDLYIQRMFQRQSEKGQTPYTNEKTTTHLTWLAQQMRHHNQTIFLIEQLQPSWLGNGRWQLAYLFLTRSVLTALWGTPIGWSFIQLVQMNPPVVKVQFLRRAAALFGITAAPWNGLFSVFIYVLGIGLVAGAVDGLFFAWRQRRGDEARIVRQLGWMQLLATGGAVWAVGTWLYCLTDEWLLALSLGSMAATSFILSFGYLGYGQSFQTEIRSRSALEWSWRNAAVLGTVGALLSLIWSGIAWLQEPGSARWLINLLNTGLTLFLLGGISGNRTEARSRPNEGIWIAGQNGIKAAVLLSVPTFVMVSLTVNLMSGLLSGLLFGFLGGVVHGMNDVSKHFAIRLLLSLERRVPLNYIRLLNYAADCILLRKMGGGYTFAHGLLLEYFADPVDVG